VGTGIVLWHCNVQEKANELSALKPLVTPQLIKGRIFPLDAMHTGALPCVRSSIDWQAIMGWRPRTTSPPSLRILPICLRIARPIVAEGFKRRPGP